MKTPKLVAWPLDGLTRIFPRDVPPRDAARRAQAGWRICAARGEYRTFQLGLLSEAKLEEIGAEVVAPRSGNGTIPQSAFQVRWVGIVPVPPDTFHVRGAERPDYVPGWYPDPLQDAPPWTSRLAPEDSPPPRTAALHFTLHIDRRARPGVYRGRVLLKCGGSISLRIPLVVEVWPFSLPKRPTFHVTNWFQLDCLTKWHRCEAWSERHWRLIELYAAEMAAHRQDVISTPTLMGNFHNSDPMTLVDARRQRGGSYRFDFRRLERWVKLFDKHGFALFEMWHLAAQGTGLHAPPFCVYDEVKRKRVWHEKLGTDSRVYRKLVGSFLDELTRWAGRRGLADRFLVHVFDEPNRKHWARYAELSAFFRAHAPKIRHLDAISTSDLITEIGGDIDIPVPLTRHLVDDEYYRQRAKAGKEPVWWYTCCGPGGRFANRFVTMPLVNTRILQWQAFVYGIGGYLHWGYNFWHRTGQQASGWPGINNYADHLLLNPYREHPAQWSVGDTCIVYPPPEWWRDVGPVGSLRYEAMREGLQDYEMLRMLDRLIASRKSRAGAKPAAARAAARRLLAKVRGPIAGSLTDFTRNGQTLLDTHDKLGRSISVLSRK